MSPLTAYVGERCHRILGQLTLHAQAPLLDVWPDALRGDRCDVQRKSARCSAALAHASNALVTAGMVLSHIQHQRRAAFERARVGFIPNPVVEEHSIAGSDGSFAIAPRIPGKANAGGGIKELACHA